MAPCSGARLRLNANLKVYATCARFALSHLEIFSKWEHCLVEFNNKGMVTRINLVQYYREAWFHPMNKECAVAS